MRASLRSMLVGTAGAAALVIGPAAAADPRVPPAAEAVQVSMRGAALSGEGTFTVPAPAAQVLAVLKDYAGIPRFVSSVKRSLVTVQVPGGVLLEQTLVGHVLFFTREMHLRLEIQESEKGLLFVDIGHADFDVYQGTWSVNEKAGVTTVIYRVTMKPRPELPAFIGVPALQAEATSLLHEIRAEILRRTSQGK